MQIYTLKKVFCPLGGECSTVGEVWTPRERSSCCRLGGDNDLDVVRCN